MRIPAKRLHTFLSVAGMAFLCLAGAVLNIIIPTVLQGRLGIPLYMDTVLTIALTFYGGLLPGLVTGALTNIISSTLIFTGWADYLFALCSMAVAFITFLFTRWFPAELRLAAPAGERESPALKSRRFKTVLDRAVALIILSFALCVVISLLGGIIAAVIKAFSRSSLGGAGPELLFNPALLRRNLPAFLVEVLSRLPVNIIDRLISVFAAYGIAWLLARHLARIRHIMVR